MLAIPAGGKMMREKVATTSAELNGVPSWNFTPSRRRKVYVLPSGDVFQLSARSGMMVLRPSAGLNRTRLLYIWPSTNRNAPWCTSKCATSAGPAHLSTPPFFGFGSAARARSERTVAAARPGRVSDHAPSAAPAVVPAAVLRNRLRFTVPSSRGCAMSRALRSWLARLPTRATAGRQQAPARRAERRVGGAIHGRERGGQPVAVGSRSPMCLQPSRSAICGQP